MVAAAVVSVKAAEEEEAEDEGVAADSHGTLALTNPAGTSKKEIATEVTNAFSHTCKRGYKPGLRGFAAPHCTRREAALYPGTALPFTGGASRFQLLDCGVKLDPASEFFLGFGGPFFKPP
jgi:hypothetical protein